MEGLLKEQRNKYRRTASRRNNDHRSAEVHHHGLEAQQPTISLDRITPKKSELISDGQTKINNPYNMQYQNLDVAVNRQTSKLETDFDDENDNTQEAVRVKTDHEALNNREMDSTYQNATHTTTSKSVLRVKNHGVSKQSSVSDKRLHEIDDIVSCSTNNELKVSDLSKKNSQSLSDPQASPAQRSMRSRSSLEKSPRTKRNKSESRRRRERKLIAAGEMEVRHANETLMKYLKQVSDLHDASLSGELEIDQNIDERHVQRQTKSQRNKRSHTFIGKVFPSGIGLSSVVNDLPDDILPIGGDIYNPFTPVVSPTEGPLPCLDKMFIQTTSGYRSMDHCFYKILIGSDPQNTHNTSVDLSCALQRCWIIVSNICHGLLGGLALAHLLLITTSQPLEKTDGPGILYYSAFTAIYTNTFFYLAIVCMVSVFDRMDIHHIDISNASELISFRWIIIVMIYVATIILTLCAETMDENLFVANLNLSHSTSHMVWNSLSITRSIGAFSGWIMIGLSPNEDILYENLLEMKKYQITSK